MLGYALSVSLVNKHLRKGVELIFHHTVHGLVTVQEVEDTGSRPIDLHTGACLKVCTVTAVVKGAKAESGDDWLRGRKCNRAPPGPGS